jgi:hypothetical protein
MHVAYLGTLHNNEEVEVALHEWLQMHDPHFYCTGIFKLMAKLIEPYLLNTIHMFLTHKNIQLNIENVSI